MLGRRAIGAIIGIISGCCLLLLLIACCIVYYRRYLTRKGINEQTSTPQPHSPNQVTNCAPSDSPPSYSEAVKGLRDILFSLFLNEMRDNYLVRWVYTLAIISFLFASCTDGKGFSGGRGGGLKGGGSFGGSKGAGTFGGSSSYNRGTSYGGSNSMKKPSSFKSNAMSFGAGALGGIAAYSVMRSMSSSYRSRPDYYESGYGTGETCLNNEDLNGTRFGRFRCPLNGFPQEAKQCCGEYERQYCCIREKSSFLSGSSSFIWIIIIIVIILIIVIVFARRHQQRQKEVIMVPMDIPADEQQGQPFYNPPPPPMGYPPPPMGYQSPPMGYPPPPMGYQPPPMGYQPSTAGDPYATQPHNYDGNFNSYPPQQQMVYPPQQQMPYPQQQNMANQPQQQGYNPYLVKE
ncbi:unnamed protein product, partial [Rotaria magnacalcarata]